MSQSKKERTVAYPHRIFNKASIYLIDKQPTQDGYKGTATLESLCLSVQCNVCITAKEGRVFDYVLSRIQALGLSNNNLTFYTDDLLNELGQTKRTENRTKILDSLNSLVDVTVTLSFGEDTIVLSLLESVQEIGWEA